MSHLPNDWRMNLKFIDTESLILAYKRADELENIKNSTAKEVIQAALKREMEHRKMMVEEDTQTIE